MLAMFFNEFRYVVDLDAIKSPRAFKNYGVEPEFGNVVFPSHVDVWRFATIQRHKEEPITSNS